MSRQGAPDDARAKLQQEEVVTRLLGGSGSSVLVARCATIYGPGQATGKRQGLITHVARCVLRSQPVRIYVPLDTMRDYVYSADAARIMIASLRATQHGVAPVVKVVASETPTTIAEILGTCRRISRRKLRFTSVADALGDLYVQRGRYKSRVFPEHKRLATTTLAQGFARVLAAERERFVRTEEGPRGAAVVRA